MEPATVEVVRCAATSVEREREEGEAVARAAEAPWTGPGHSPNRGVAEVKMRARSAAFGGGLDEERVRERVERERPREKEVAFWGE